MLLIVVFFYYIKNYSPLHTAMSSKYIEITKILIENGANLNLSNVFFIYFFIYIIYFWIISFIL